MSTGQGLGAVGGAVAGFFLTGGNPIGALKGAAIGYTLGGIIDPNIPHTTNYGPRLSDTKQQTSTYGAVIPRIYGTVPIVGNVFWLENGELKEVAITQESGGKGGGGGTTSVSYSYYATFAVGLCEGPIIGIKRLWIGSDLVYDAGSDDATSIQASNDAAEGFTLYTGTNTQLADSRIQATLGTSDVPGYRGIAYLVIEDLPLVKYGNSLAVAQIKAEVVGAGSYVEHFTPYAQTPVTLPSAAKGVIWSGSNYVLVPNDNSTTAYSLTGVTGSWTTASTAGNSGSFVYTMESDDNDVIYIGSLAGGNNYAVSDDNGASWTGYSYPLGIKRVIYNSSAGVWCGMLFFDILHSGIRTLLAYGGAFDALTLTTSLTGSGEWLESVNGLFVAGFGSGYSDYITSPDGLVWTSRVLPFTRTRSTSSSDENTLVLLEGTSYWKTTDGINWTQVILPSGYSGTNITIKNDWVYISVPGNNKCIVSPDAGSTWTEFTPLSGTYSVGSFSISNNSLLILTSSTTAELISLRSSLGYFIETSNVNLSDIVSTECQKSGILESGDLTTTSLTDTVRGYKISTVGSIRAALEPLRGSWPFDAIQSGYKLKFIRRGGSSVASVTEDELDARNISDSPGVEFNITREMDTQLPKKIRVTYLDYNREYDIGEQYLERLNTDAINEQTIELPIVLTADEGIQKCEVLLYNYWLERRDVTFKLPPTYINLEPADIVTLTVGNLTYSLRLIAINYSSDCHIECSAKFNDSAIYTPVSEGEDGQSTGQTITLVGDAVFQLMDIPLILDEHNVPGYFAGMTAEGDGWPGGVLYRTDDGGSTFVSIDSFASPGAVMGTASDYLSANDGTLIDKSGTLTVTLTQGELSSVTEAQMLNGYNHFAYGINGRYEIIAAQNCVEQIDGSYVLTDFLRGRFGTEWATGLHAASDNIVKLNSSYIHFLTTSSSLIGITKTFRAVTLGKTLASGSGTDTNFTYNGVNLKPYSPVYLNGDIDPGTNDWTLTWIRRTRISGELRDYVNVPIGESSESYEIDIYDDSGYSNVLRTLTSTTNSVEYTSAQQVADFGSNQSTLYVKIYQMSDIIGRGYALTDSITR